MISEILLPIFTFGMGALVGYRWHSACGPIRRKPEAPGCPHDELVLDRLGAHEQRGYRTADRVFLSVETVMQAGCYCSKCGERQVITLPISVSGLGESKADDRARCFAALDAMGWLYHQEDNHLIRK